MPSKDWKLFELAVEERLREVDPRIERIVLYPEIKIYQDYGAGRYYAGDFLRQGSGVRSFIKYAIEAAKHEKGIDILLFDEPELGLYPINKQKLMLDLLDYVRKYRIQVFMATHDPAFWIRCS